MQKSYLLQDYKLKQDSIFDLGELYKLLFRWFENNGYSFYEKNYVDQETPTGKLLQIYWVAEKKIDTYIKFGIEVNYFATGLSKVEIERGGVKISTNKGGIQLNISAYLMKDYDSKWSSSPLMKNMRRMYDSFIIRERIGSLTGELDNECQSLLDEIRSFLALHKY